MCSCGITFGVSAIAAITSSVKSRGCGDVKRTRSRPSTSAAGAQQLAEGEPVTELDAVRVDVLPEQRHLQHTFGDQRLDLGEHVAGAAVPLGAAQRRHDAERAGVVAPDADRDPGGVGRLATGRQGGREHVERLEDLDLCLPVHPGPLEEDRQRPDVVGAEDDVDVRRPAGDLGAVLLRQTAADGDLHARPGGLDGRQVAEVAVELVVGVLPDRAGVEDDDVRVGAGRGPHVACLLEQPGQPLGVVHVHLAPVGADLVGACRRARHRPPRVRRSARRQRAAEPATTERGPRGGWTGAGLGPAGADGQTGCRRRRSAGTFLRLCLGS